MFKVTEGVNFNLSICLINRYRSEVSPQARWVVSACGTKELNTADPDDHKAFDFAGFDRSVPKMIAGFIDERF